MTPRLALAAIVLALLDATTPASAAWRLCPITASGWSPSLTCESLTETWRPDLTPKGDVRRKPVREGE